MKTLMKAVLNVGIRVYAFCIFTAVYQDTWNTVWSKQYHLNHISFTTASLFSGSILLFVVVFAGLWNIVWPYTGGD